MKSKFILTILSFLCFLQGFSQEENLEYSAGYKTIHLLDSSRIYKPNANESDRLRYRPLEIDVWYPSDSKTGKSMLFGELFQVLEERSNKFQDETDYTGFTEELATLFAVGSGLKPEEGNKLLKLTTESYANLAPSIEDFPLIIYMAGYNGMGFESYRILEKLAENGFLVVSISSVGRYPGDMTNDKLDTMEQVYDAEFALQALKQQADLNIDFGTIGILGLSWGGMSGIILLDRNPNIKAFVSLDGSDVFYYGSTEEDDAFLSEIYDSDLIHPEKTNAAYLHLQSGNRLEEFTPTDEYHYFKKINSPKKYLRFTNSLHEDFGSLGWALKVSPERIEISEDITKSTVSFFKEYLKNETGFLKQYEKLLKKENITDQPFEYSSEPLKELVLKGHIQNDKSNEALAYVNIGVLNKDWGTVTNKNGEFELILNESHTNDTLRISMVGFAPRTILVKNVLNRKEGFKLELKEQISDLEEVVVTAKKWKYKTLGNKTKSKFLGSGFAYDMLGSEMGVRINVRKKPTFIQSFNFNIPHNKLSAKAIFRFNLYEIKGGKPSENIFKESILIPIAAGQSGEISTDLKKV
ncbi:carboxypeptidase-like regulatory domain-containing protein [Zobellia nedashkovskayae]